MFRFTLRSLARTPVFTATVIATLALGIGANTAIFTMVDRLLLRPLPYPNAVRIMMMYEFRSTSPRMDVSPANWLDWRRESRSFDALAAWSNRFAVTLTGEGEPERLKVQAVSREFLRVLGVRPILGRDFVAEDDLPGAPRRVILGYDLWQRRFSGNASIIGRILQLNATPAEVIGVMAPGFRFMSNDTDLWLAYALDRNRAWRESGGRVGSVRRDCSTACVTWPVWPARVHCCGTQAGDRCSHGAGRPTRGSFETGVGQWSETGRHRSSHRIGCCFRAVAIPRESAVWRHRPRSDNVCCGRRPVGAGERLCSADSRHPRHRSKSYCGVKKRSSRKT